MKKVWSIISNVIVCLLAVMAVCMMVFTIFAVNTFDRNDRSIFGYKMLIVLSDSMSATDFKAGDLIFVKETKPQELKPGDIIAYVSQDSENYGETVAHKIRKAVTDDQGNQGFVTYGTTTDVDDKVVVTWPNILGHYRMKIPGVGTFFSYLKTVPGYILFIVLPFLLLIFFQGANCVRLFREYRHEEMSSIVAERAKLKEEREAARLMLEELERLKAYEKGRWEESEEDGQATEE